MKQIITIIYFWLFNFTLNHNDFNIRIFNKKKFEVLLGIWISWRRWCPEANTQNCPYSSLCKRLVTFQVQLKPISKKTSGICSYSFPRTQKQGETEISYLKGKAPSILIWNVKAIWFRRKDSERIHKPESIIVLSFHDTTFLIPLKDSQSLVLVSKLHPINIWYCHGFIFDLRLG